MVDLSRIENLLGGRRWSCGNVNRKARKNDFQLCEILLLTSHPEWQFPSFVHFSINRRFLLGDELHVFVVRN